MQQKKTIRTRWLTVRMSEDEFATMTSHFKASDSREISDYVRRLVLNKPVNVKYRNTSIDDFLAEMQALKRELNALGNNFNQSVHKLHTLEHLPEFQSWILHNEKDKALLFSRIDAILSRIESLYRLWLQS